MCGWPIGDPTGADARRQSRRSCWRVRSTETTKIRITYWLKCLSLVRATTLSVGSNPEADMVRLNGQWAYRESNRRTYAGAYMVAEVTPNSDRPHERKSVLEPLRGAVKPT